MENRKLSWVGRSPNTVVRMNECETRLSSLIKRQMLRLAIFKILWLYGIYKMCLNQDDTKLLEIMGKYTFHTTQ